MNSTFHPQAGTWSDELRSAIAEWIADLDLVWSKTAIPGTHGEVSYGKAYARIIRRDNVSASAHAFVDKEGNIWKASSWAAPAKNFVRGNVLLRFKR